MRWTEAIGLVALGAVLATVVLTMIREAPVEPASDAAGVQDATVRAVDAETEASPAVESEDVRPSASPTAIVVPHRYRFAGIDRVEIAENTDQLLGRYHGEELDYLIGYYHSFTPAGSGFDVLDFHNREQMQWLVQNGYPMPEEVLQARRMGQEELLELSRQGNIKAQMFYVDLTASTLGNPPRDTRLSPDQVLASSEWLRTVDKVLSSGSPFAGYVAAKAKKESGKGHGAAAAFQLARMLGDTRAQAAIDLVSAEGADANVELAQFYGMLLSLSRGSDVNGVLRSSDPGFPPR